MTQDEKIDAAVAAMLEYLRREQDAEYRVLPKGEHDDDMDNVFMHGVFSLRMLALHAVEAVT